MGLIGNGSVLNKSPAFLTSGTGAQSGHAGNFHRSGRHRNREWMFEKSASYPDGYGVPYALKLAQKSSATSVASQTDIAGVGSISNANAISARISTADLSGSGAISDAALGQIVKAAASISGTGSVSSAALTSISTMSSTLAGSGSISDASMKALIPVSASLSGSASLSPNLKGTGTMTADITPFTDLSPQSLATQILDSNEIETNYTLREALRIILASVGGKLSGAETTTVTIRNITDDKNRIVATVDSNGNRTAVTYDVSDS